MICVSRACSACHVYEILSSLLSETFLSFLCLLSLDAKLVKSSSLLVKVNHHMSVEAKVLRCSYDNELQLFFYFSIISNDSCYISGLLS